MSPLTVLAWDSSRGVLAYAADAAELDHLEVTDRASEGCQFILVPRATDAPLDPHTRKWEEVRIPSKEHTVATDGLWVNSTQSTTYLGSRSVNPPGRGWVLRAEAGDGYEFFEELTASGPRIGTRRVS